MFVVGKGHLEGWGNTDKAIPQAIHYTVTNATMAARQDRTMNRSRDREKGNTVSITDIPSR
jgi:hypothetical protein